MNVSSELFSLIERFQGEIISIKVSKETYDIISFEFANLSLTPDKQPKKLLGMQINGVEINHD